jgi:hypothetical protein
MRVVRRVANTHNSSAFERGACTNGLLRPESKEGKPMKHRLCLASAVLALVAAPGPAAAAPKPSYDIACTDGLQTTVNWRHAKVTGITFTWLAPQGSTVTFTPLPVPVSTKKPRGFAVVPTASSVNGVSPAQVVLSVALAGGGTDQAQADCA